MSCSAEPSPPNPPSSGGYGASVGGASVGGASAGGASVGGASAGGGVSAGGAGAGGVSAGGASVGGASAGGGVSAGGASGSGGVAQGSFAISPAQMSFTIDCEFTPQPLTITNTSEVTLTWTSTGLENANAGVVLSPPTATLLAGQAMTVSVVPLQTPPVFRNTTLTVDADAAPSQVLKLTENVSGIFVAGLPSDIDFGEVPLGTTATAFVPTVSFQAGGEFLASSNFAFQLSGAAPNLQEPGNRVGWILTFRPTVDGPQQSTLSYGSFVTQLCPPNSIIARGTGIGAAPPPPFLNFP